MRFDVTRLCLALSLGIAAFGPAPSFAQDLLEQAEEAYLQVDFDEAARLAQGALETGDNDARRVFRIYQIIGFARAVAGDAEGARNAYMRMLAVRPDAQGDRDQSPQLRAPLLEARGYWANRSERFGLDLLPSTAQRGMRVRLSDPLRMAASITLYTRSLGDFSYDEARLPPRSSQLTPVSQLGDGEAIEYYAAIYDPYGNQLFTVGSEDEPRRFGELATVAATPAQNDSNQGSLFRSPVFWSIAGAVLVAGGVTAGLLIANQERGQLRSRYSIQE